MDTRFDALHPRVPVAAPTQAPPRPAPAPWARAWAHEWQQAASTTDSPAAAGDVRVAWRDASAASTWLAPVRPRGEEGPQDDPHAARQQADPEARTSDTRPAARHTAAGPHDTPASPVLPFVPAAPQVARPQPALWPGQGLTPPLDAGTALADAGTALADAGTALADAGSAPALASARTAPAGLHAGAALPPAGRPGPAAPGQAPHTPPPNRPGEARPFAPTNLQVTPGEDGPAVWLRDARLSPDGPANSQVLQVLQALASLGWPHTLRPGALFLNGRPLGLASTARALPPQGHPQPPPFPKEDPHGH